MSERDGDQFERQVAAELRSMGQGLQPESTLHDRVRERLGARRRRMAVQMLSASVLVVGLGATALVLNDDDRTSHVQTSDESTPSAAPDASDATAPIETDALSPVPVDTDVPTVGEAMNILVVGLDNGACLESDSPYAPAFGDRTGIGDRSDTIMIVRLEPALGRASILSFPPDLWVPIAGRDSEARINGAYVRDDPSRLIATISENFGIGVDHFVQIDFCGFTSLVDAVGGVPVPFDHPVRDTHTGLNVPEPGCRTLNGDEALAYVRARHYQFLQNGVWVDDPSSDLGRISRQQDFVQRTMTAVLAGGFTDPGRVRSVIEAVQSSLVVDTGLTIGRMLSIAGDVQSMADSIGHYQIQATPQTIGGNAILVPVLEGESMQSVLALFRGEQPAAEQQTPTVPADNLTGIVPPTSITC